MLQSFFFILYPFKIFIYIEHFQLFTLCIDLDKLWYPDVKSKNKTVLPINFLLYCSHFSNKLILYVKCSKHFSQTFCIYVTNGITWTNFSAILVKLRKKMILLMTLFIYVHIFWTLSVFSNFEHYLETINLMFRKNQYGLHIAM